MNNALNGIRLAFKERNMRIHLCAAFYVIAAGLIVNITADEWRSIMLCIGLVMGMECLNTGLEALCDTLRPEKDRGIKAAKDAAAGGVLISAAVSAIIGGCIFFNADSLSKAAAFITGRPVIFSLLVLLLPAWVYYIVRSKKDGK
ncbi:MAG: diacylglycerol kinase family protein [Oscillospiraceae bacterium]|jgi:diacylglycerol kinase